MSEKRKKSERIEPDLPLILVKDNGNEVVELHTEIRRLTDEYNELVEQRESERCLAMARGEREKGAKGRKWA